MPQTIAIIGAGIVGLATAHQLQLKYPAYKVLVFEKEAQIGLHQSGRNSGVLHCGLYYEPGSLKAKLAVEGLKMMVNFCKENNVNHDICGKVVVATNDKEEEALEALRVRGEANGLDGLRYLTLEELQEREPYVWAQKALLVPQEGIVDFTGVMEQMAAKIRQKGGEIILKTHLDFVKESASDILLSNGINEWRVDQLICCAGLNSDRVFEQYTGAKSPIKIIPFRGEYLAFKPAAQQMVNHLIYPVPDAQYPFLGVHFTRMINGEKEVGPNAVLARKREGYRLTDFSFSDTMEVMRYKGFWKFIGKHLKFSANEFYSSIDSNVFLSKARKMMPELKLEHLQKGNAGVRAQAMDMDGNLIMDFNIEKRGRQIHVLNAPSPGATASLAIADYILDTYL